MHYVLGVDKHNYLDFSEYFLYLYLKFCKVTELFRCSFKLFQILAPVINCLVLVRL